MLVIFVPASYNPMRLAVPAAFAVAGLVQLSIAAAWATGIVTLHGSELIAMDEVRRVWGTLTTASITRVLVAFTAPIWGAWAIPLGSLLAGFTLWLGFSTSLAVAYSSRSKT